RCGRNRTPTSGRPCARSTAPSATPSACSNAARVLPASHRRVVVYDPRMIDAIGFAAATLTTLSFVPQLVKTWQTRSSGDLSLGMLLAFAAGIVLWIVFGVATHAAPVIVANVATLALAACQIGLTLRYRQQSGASTGRPAGLPNSKSTSI